MKYFIQFNGSHFDYKTVTNDKHILFCKALKFPTATRLAASMRYVEMSEFYMKTATRLAASMRYVEMSEFYICSNYLH